MLPKKELFMRKLLKTFGVIALVAVIGFSITACPEVDAESDFEARPVGGTGVEITKYVGNKWEVNIPSKIQNLPVISIGESAFSSKQLVSVTIPNSVTDIGERAFYGNQLTKVTIPKSVTYIDYYAFYGNPLTSVTIGANVELASSYYYSFPGNFYSVYNNGGKMAGTYIRPDTGSDWTKK